MTTLAETFKAEALRLLQARVDSLRHSLTFASALALPEAQFSDIVISGREAQFTLFRQADHPSAGTVLVTAQIARHSMGGVTSFLLEKGLVISPDEPARDATDEELLSVRQ